MVAGLHEALDRAGAGPEVRVAVTVRLWSFPKPTIAEVSGYCLGGTCELAMACDLVVCAEDTHFGEPEIRYGSGPVTLLVALARGGAGRPR